MNIENIEIRKPKLSDLKQALLYVNNLSKERTYVTLQGEIIDEKTERTWLRKVLEKIQNKKAVYLFAFDKKQLIGIAEITMGSGYKEHVGRFGISIDKKFRGKGIGTALMDAVLKESKSLLKLRIICLEVFAENTGAISLYRKKGFVFCGEIPKVIKRKGKFVDEILMYKAIK